MMIWILVKQPITDEDDESEDGVSEKTSDDSSNATEPDAAAQD